jgi:hypothetical protein
MVRQVVAVSGIIDRYGAEAACSDFGQGHCCTLLPGNFPDVFSASWILVSSVSLQCIVDRLRRRRVSKIEWKHSIYITCMREENFPTYIVSHLWDRTSVQRLVAFYNKLMTDQAWEMEGLDMCYLVAVDSFLYGSHFASGFNNHPSVMVNLLLRGRLRQLSNVFH